MNGDGAPNGSRDLANLPVYALESVETGATVQVTDPGKTMLSGNNARLNIGLTPPQVRDLVAFSSAL